MATFCYVCPDCSETVESPWRMEGNFAGIVCDCGTMMRRDYKAEAVSVHTASLRKAR